MKRLRVVPIVEGHGEVECVRILIERAWRELGGEFVDVLRPIRGKRQKLVRKEDLGKAVRLAVSKLANPGLTPDPGLVLVLLDADTDPPCHLGPELLGFAQEVASSTDVACVLAKVEYETWFVAAAESLEEYLDLSEDEQVPENPEEQRLGKGWIEHRFKGTKYSETQDQPSMTAKMDLSLCRRRSPSFEKLCRDLARRLEAAESTG